MSKRIGMYRRMNDNHFVLSDLSQCLISANMNLEIYKEVFFKQSTEVEYNFGVKYPLHKEYT
jgi:hypothetical protein